jgi:hypothetical protein
MMLCRNVDHFMLYPESNEITNENDEYKVWSSIHTKRKETNKLKSGRITQVQTYLSKELNFYAIVINLLSLHWFYCDLNMTANTKIVTYYGSLDNMPKILQQ